MTIIKNTITLQKCPFVFIDQPLADALSSSYVVHKNTHTVTAWKEQGFKLLECYCHILNQRIGMSDLRHGFFKALTLDFFRVLKGNSLLPTDEDHKALRFSEIRTALIKVLKTQNEVCTDWLEEISWDSIEGRDLSLEKLDKEVLLYWASWPVLSRKGRKTFLNLTPLYHSHGPKFTVQIYSRWNNFVQKQAVPNNQHINRFALFLANDPKRWPTSTFTNPISLVQCFKEFMKANFLEVHKAGKDLQSQIKGWNRFISNIEEVFIQPNVWPEPFGAGLPTLQARSIPGAKTKISKSESGTEVHNKLITEVPLECTDEQAMKLLFTQIHTDLNTVEQWAKSQAWDLRRRQLGRKNLAAKGDPFSPTSAAKTISEADLPNLSAKFEHFGFFPSNERSHELDMNTIYGWNLPKGELAHNLGLPTVDSLFPFMCLLVIRHPAITHSFLRELELFNKHNQVSGFLKTDSHYQLVGYKDRRTKTLAEQKIKLSAKSAALVRQVIEITQPLRDYLRSQGDDSWRRLFLTSGKGFSYPQAGRVTSWRSPKFNSLTSVSSLERQFSKHTQLRDYSLKQFLNRVTLGSIRASRGVQIYLSTKSVHEMAEALGHAKFKPELLSHYLPESILAFFQTRWVRIFQKAFICEAMKDSPYLLEATEFESMEELHEFLKNHAIKDISANLINPENIPLTEVAESEDSQVLISINKGILTALLSINRAVEQSQEKDRISGLAKYWSDISGLIEKEIRHGTDHLLKQHLSVAEANLNPEKMEGLIYESAA